MTDLGVAALPVGEGADAEREDGREAGAEHEADDEHPHGALKGERDVVHRGSFRGPGRGGERSGWWWTPGPPGWMPGSPGWLPASPGWMPGSPGWTPAAGPGAGVDAGFAGVDAGFPADDGCPGVPSHSSLTLCAPIGARRARSHIHDENAARTTKMTTAPSAPPMRVADEPHDRADEARRRQGDGPGGQHATGDVPPHRARRARRPSRGSTRWPRGSWTARTRGGSRTGCTAAELLSAAMPWAGEMSMRPLPRVRMMRQPPSQVPRAMADAALTLTQNGHARGVGPHARGDEREGHDAHRLLGVVRAVRQGHEGRRPDLAPAKAASAGSAR